MTIRSVYAGLTAVFLVGLGSFALLEKATADPSNNSPQNRPEVPLNRPPRPNFNNSPQDQTNFPRRRPPRPDFAAAAKKLGVTEAQLIEALGLPAKPPEPPNIANAPQCPPRPPRLPISEAAKQLNISESSLVKALGLLPRPPEFPSDRPPMSPDMFPDDRPDDLDNY